ncbi:hypothetical protein OGAPHI_005090 [Ogataea philodendri]|uniref:Uncharacterized protein n=1 Tax=Ogataea philodendri TaxID=1378263 RepID=A0A9P8P2V0_9ASCO|nr:uncharacterized protein OGAPHI_005090 [Ogataea philodendri]KAH3663689.1 hypothetical protein OGAPHI_005090 [Ogataea philodendri]
MCSSRLALRYWLDGSTPGLSSNGRLFIQSCRSISSWYTMSWVMSSGQTVALFLEPIAVHGDVFVVELYWHVLVKVVLADCTRQTQHRVDVNVHLVDGPEQPFSNLELDGVEWIVQLSVQAFSQRGSKRNANVCVAGGQSGGTLQENDQHHNRLDTVGVSGVCDVDQLSCSNEISITFILKHLVLGVLLAVLGTGGFLVALEEQRSTGHHRVHQWQEPLLLVGVLAGLCVVCVIRRRATSREGRMILISLPMLDSYEPSMPGWTFEAPCGLWKCRVSAGEWSRGFIVVDTDGDFDTVGNDGTGTSGNAEYSSAMVLLESLDSSHDFSRSLFMAVTSFIGLIGRGLSFRSVNLMSGRSRWRMSSYSLSLSVSLAIISGLLIGSCELGPEPWLAEPWLDGEAPDPGWVFFFVLLGWSYVHS